MEFEITASERRHRSIRQTLLVEADDQNEAMKYVVGLGWSVDTIRPAIALAASPRSSRTPFPILQFSQELLALLSAGLNLYEAVSTLSAKENRASVRAILDVVLLSLKNGTSFSDTLMALPNEFPDIYVASVRAAERSGNLGDALERFIAYQIQLDVIRKKLSAAAVYPVMLLIVGALVALFLLGYVVPKFSAVYDSAGRDIPWMSEMLLKAGRGIAANTSLFVLILVMALGSIAYLILNRTFRVTLQDKIMELPGIAERA
jgi:general secretion pathway protein F